MQGKLLPQKRAAPAVLVSALPENTGHTDTKRNNENAPVTHHTNEQRKSATVQKRRQLTAQTHAQYLGNTEKGQEAGYLDLLSRQGTPQAQLSRYTRN